MSPIRLKTLVVAILALVAFAALATTSSSAMRSSKIGKHLCETTGGGKFVPIPGFPGERIDRRLLPDIKHLVHRYDIFITDGLSDDPVHAAGGEHPIGLAIDIVPDTSLGGSWKEVNELARFAEPVQDEPVAPFRWVGYNGDPGHGRGNHLHLSWNHSETKPGHPARTVYTLRCPEDDPSDDGSGRGDGKKGDGKNNGGGGGGLHPGGGSQHGDGGGGLQPRQLAARALARFDALAADPVIESGGVGLP